MEIRVSFQGERGSFSEDAVLKFFGQADPTPFRHFSAVFEAVSRGSTDCGVVPVENSQAGSINETYDLLLEYDLNSVKDIKKIYSHPGTGSMRGILRFIGGGDSDLRHRR